VTDTASSPSSAAIKTLVIINKLQVKAFNAETREALNFIILNDTSLLLRYDRAVLWEFRENSLENSHLLGVSGQSDIDDKSELANSWAKIISNIKEPLNIQVLNDARLTKNIAEWHIREKEQSGTKVVWIPIVNNNALVGCAWIERWNDAPLHKEELDVLALLFSGYNAAWGKFTKKHTYRKFFTQKLFYVLAFLLLFSFLFKVPLRVVAPCEVVAKDPILVTAPLNGTIADVFVDPGQFVDKGDLLFEYDKRVPLQELKVSEKQVEIIQSEINRSETSGFNDDKFLAELSVLRHKLEEEKIKLDLAEYHAGKLSVKSPIDGVVLLDKPNEWRGKPVQVGEKILFVSDPSKTRIKLWVPIDDNVDLDPAKKIKIFLNVSPDASFEASLKYIANYSDISDKSVPAFEGEAEWIEQAEDIKMGLKGTAILYGDDVSFFYYIFRKPWAYFRQLFAF
jgi:hypothetical protein